MKFLLDVNMPPSLGEYLKTLGHSYRWVPACMDPTVSDLRIIQEATATGEVILTHDTDFGTLLSFFSTVKPSVVLFRIDKINAGLFFDLLIDNWSLIGQPLEEGSLVIIEKDKLRVQDCPLNDSRISLHVTKTIEPDLRAQEAYREGYDRWLVALDAAE